MWLNSCGWLSLSSLMLAAVDSYPRLASPRSHESIDLHGHQPKMPWHTRRWRTIPFPSIDCFPFSSLPQLISYTTLISSSSTFISRFSFLPLSALQCLFQTKAHQNSPTRPTVSPRETAKRKLASAISHQVAATLSLTRDHPDGQGPEINCQV